MDDRIEEAQGGNQIEEPREEEGLLSDDVFDSDLGIDDILDRLENNDPRLSNVKIDVQNIAQNNNDTHETFARFGMAIRRNTHVQALMLFAYNQHINISEAEAHHVMILLHGIACNQSIKRLHFLNYGEYLGTACRILTPLFKNNQVERIRIARCELSHEGIRLLTASLIEFDSLKEFALDGARMIIPQEVSRDLVQSLPGHSRLRKLDLAYTNVGGLGCSALVDLLSNPNTKLKVLEITNNNLGDDDAIALSSRMAGSVSLKEINLACNRGITQAGWRTIFDALSDSSCRSEKLSLEGNDINDAAAQSLSDALASNTTLKTLNLAAIRGITLTGWRVLFHFLRSQTCALENLNLRYNQFNDEVMVSLTDALASNRSLKSLNLSDNFEVTGATWQRFFSTVLTNPSSELEKLDLRCCDINDDINDATIRALTNALVNNSKLKVLYLNSNDLITNAGWEMFSSVLDSPHTALEEFHLEDSDIDDDTATLLVTSLANNKKLKKFFFQHSVIGNPLRLCYVMLIALWAPTTRITHLRKWAMEMTCLKNFSRC